jgi:hypothetical protein
MNALTKRTIVPLVAALLLVTVFAVLPWQAAITLIVLLFIVGGSLFEQIARWWRGLDEQEPPSPVTDETAAYSAGYQACERPAEREQVQAQAAQPKEEPVTLYRTPPIPMSNS